VKKRDTWTRAIFRDIAVYVSHGDV
jgi:hypothetical protein